MTATRNEIVQKVRAAVADIRPIPENVSDEDFATASLTEDYSFDSLDLINVLFNIEEEFGIKFDEEKIDSETLVNIKDLCSYIEAEIDS